MYFCTSVGVALCQSENISPERRGNSLGEIHHMHRTPQLRAPFHLFHMIRAHLTMEKRTNFEIISSNINRNMNGRYPLYNELCGWKTHVKCEKCNIQYIYVL